MPPTGPGGVRRFNLAKEQAAQHGGEAVEQVVFVVRM